MSGGTRLDPTKISASILARMNPGDRARYAPAGSLSPIAPESITGDEASPSKAELREEKALQTEFENWLRQHGYVYRREPMHRATFAPAGHPDFTVTLAGGRVVYFEYKAERGKLSPEQREWHRQAQERGIPVFVSRSLQFSIDCLRAVERAATTPPAK